MKKVILRYNKKDDKMETIVDEYTRPLLPNNCNCIVGNNGELKLLKTSDFSSLSLTKLTEFYIYCEDEKVDESIEKLKGRFNDRLNDINIEIKFFEEECNKALRRLEELKERNAAIEDAMNEL